MPEVASRRHLELVTPVVSRALTEADATLDEIGAVAARDGITADPAFDPQRPAVLVVHLDPVPLYPIFSLDSEGATRGSSPAVRRRT